MILAGDVGGTKILLALFGREGGRLAPGPRARLDTTATASLPEAVAAFAAEHGVRPTAAAFGIAGPIVDGCVRGANLPWTVGEAEISAALGGVPVRFLNDLEASGHGLEQLGPGDLVPLQEGEADPRGNRGLVSPGTGLGETVLVRLGDTWHPTPSEGGHADFAPRTDEEVELLLWLRAAYGRASWERVVSGPGLVNVLRFLRAQGRIPDDAPDVAAGPDAADAAPAISERALEGSSELCRAALRVWASVFGAEAGNVALRGLTLGGVFLAGGIPARVLPALRDEPWFLDAFRDKAPHRELLERVPVRVVTAPDTSLLGAARVAARIALADTGG